MTVSGKFCCEFNYLVYLQGCSKACVGLVGALVLVTLVAVPTAIYVNSE